jgi:O-antigen ligase
MKAGSLRPWLQALILLSPLPLGCAGGPWEPACFLAFAVFACFALAGEGTPPAILYLRPLRVLALLFLAFIVLQLLPLPLFMLKALAPQAPTVLASVTGAAPVFHPLSLIPAETAMALARFLVYGLFFVALLRIDWGKRDILAVFGAALLSGVVQTVFALLKLGQGNTKFFLFFMADDHVPGFLRGTIYNPDHFAFYLELLFPLALGLLFARLHVFDPGENLREKFLHLAEDRRLIVLFLAPVLLAAGIYLTGCRTGIAVMVLSLLFFAMMSVYMRAHPGLHKNLRMIFILATLLAVFVGLQNTLEKFLGKSLFESTGRLDYWSSTLRMVADFPVFGTGLGTFKYSYYLYGRQENWVSHAHNDWLESLSDLGAAGALLFLALLFLLAYSLLRMWAARRHPEIKPVVLGVLTALFAAAFHSVFDFSLRVPANAFLLIVLAAMAMKLVTYKKDFRDEKR